MLCKWCSGFCQKVSSLLLGFFCLLCYGFCVFFSVLFFVFVLCFYCFPPIFFTRPTQRASRQGPEESSPAAREGED